MSLNPLEKVGGRKFVVALTVLGLAVGTDVLAAKGLSTNLMATLLGVLGAFSASNLVSKRYAPKTSAKASADEQRLVTEEEEPEVEQVVKESAGAETWAASHMDVEGLEARVAAIEEAGEQIMKNQQLLSQSIQALQRVVANGRQGQ